MSERASLPAFGVSASGAGRIAAAAALFALVASPFGVAAADVYKCVESGRTSYQDQPCGSAATVVRTDSALVDRGRAAAAAESVARLRSDVAQLEQARKARDLAAEIERVEREIQGYRKAEQDELAALRDQQNYANNNQPGAVWERAAVQNRIARDMQAVSDKYALRTQAARERLAQLRKSGGELPKPANGTAAGAASTTAR
jgi:hypothetical protein